MKDGGSMWTGSMGSRELPRKLVGGSPRGAGLGYGGRGEARWEARAWLGAVQVCVS